MFGICRYGSGFKDSRLTLLGLGCRARRAHGVSRLKAGLCLAAVPREPNTAGLGCLWFIVPLK